MTARARTELRALQERVPRTVHRVQGQTLLSPPLEDVVAGDLLLVQPGEIVPVDGRVERDVAVLDEWRSPVNPARSNDRSATMCSGTVNAGDAFMLRATKPRRRAQLHRHRAAGGRRGGGGRRRRSAA